VLDGEGQVHAHEHDQGLKHIPQPPEKGIDGRLGLVFGLSTGRQKEGVAHRVLEGVVGAVSPHFDDLDDRQNGGGDEEGIASQGQTRQDEKGAADPNVFKDSGYQEQLNEEAEQVLPAVKVSVELSDHHLHLGIVGRLP